MSKETVETNAEVIEPVTDAGVYKFKKPTKIDGEEVKEIRYDFSEINGAAIRRAKSELQKRGYTVAVKELDEVFHSAIFAMASGLTIDNVEAFSAVDYMGVADIARDFLNGED